MRLAWNVVIRTLDGRHWWNLHVDAVDGSVLRQDDWIAHDAYRVFPQPLVSPDDGPRSLVTGPADPLASPWGWHDTNGVAGAEYSDTRGNNVFAQEDTDASDSGGYRPGGGAGLTFDFPLGLTLQPGNYLDASISNLFYWNNLLHDVFYRYGFDEAAGNFQADDYGRGGLAGDPVQADAQDGADVDNAQFGTPPDGQSPRMEMFLWNQLPDPQLVVTTPAPLAGAYAAGRALFGAGTQGLSQGIVLAQDAADANGSATTDACSPLTNAAAVAGHLALIDRGSCNFNVKVAHAQAAGAVGAIVANNQNTLLINMSGVDPSIVIPSIFVSRSLGNAIKSYLGGGVTATLVSPADRDGDLEGAVIAHEFGHGVTNRLTGGPSNVSCLDQAQSAGMGEGWSDFFAMTFTAKPGASGADPVPMAPYLIGEPPSGPGIRHYSYSTDLGIDPLTYADIASLDPPHGVGEVWAAALWEMYWNLVGVYGFDPDLALGAGGNEIALGLVVDALALQPCEPTFLDARDAILSADSLADAGANRCLIWAAFAKRGMGASAADGGASTSVAVTEAFDVPAECTPACGDALLQAGEQCDDGNTQGFDGCAATCRTETPLRISGSAQGGSVSVTVDGRLITVATSPGQSGSSVAAALAAAIAADPVLSAAGETAAVQGNQIAVTGTVTGFTLGDAGLLPIPVPSLSPRGALLAAAVLALAALHLLRRRGAAEAA